MFEKEKMSKGKLEQVVGGESDSERQEAKKSRIEILRSFETGCPTVEVTCSKCGRTFMHKSPGINPWVASATKPECPYCDRGLDESLILRKD